MEFSRLPHERAVEFCEHVVAREPYMLRELASWLEQTGGPIEAMDASVASLVPLGEWYLDLARADFLGLTDGLVPSTHPELTGEHLTREEERDRRSAVGGERFSHYVRLVADRLAPGSYWGVHRPRGRMDNLFHQPVVYLPGWPSPWPGGGDLPMFFYSSMIGLAGAAAIRGITDPAWPGWSALLSVPPELQSRPQDPGPSVLTPYLTLDLPPMPEVARISPAAIWLHETDPVSASVTTRPRPQDEDWEDLILAKGPARGLDDDPGLLAALPADRVAAALTEGGFAGVDTAAVLRGGDLPEHPDDVAHVMTATHEGTLRALHIQALNPTPESWERLIAPLRRLAAELGANLVPEGEYPGAGDDESKE